MYNSEQQANSIAQIFQAEGVKDSIIPNGHDWVCRTNSLIDGKKLSLVPDCEGKVINATH